MRTLRGFVPAFEPRQAAIAAAFAGVLVLTWLCFAPGLGGTFLFDDSPNLSGLKEVAADPSPGGMLHYVFGGAASTLGRPLALATFAMQFRSWPFAAGDFIRVNILIHLLNAALLFAVLMRLRRMLAFSDAGAVVLVLVWACAPLQLTSVLYIVQRMALLSATCMLGGLLLYVWGRTSPVTPRRALLRMTAGLGVGTGLGVLCKENAALFPLLCAVLEGTLLRDCPRPEGWRQWSRVCLAAPIALLAVYLLLQLPSFVAAYADRPFTMGQRLLSEARVLFGYLYKLLVPPMATPRLLYDDFEISRSLLAPPLTALAVLAWCGLVAGAWRWRARAPMAAFAVLWFLACHAIESSFVPLELVFDHRNYLAMLGPLAAALWYARRLLDRPEIGSMRRPLMVLGIVWLVAALAACRHGAELWGKPMELAGYWVQRQPHSMRAYHQFSDVLLRSGYPDDALALYRKAQAMAPRDPSVLVSILLIGCYYPGGDTEVWDLADAAVRDPQGHLLTTVNTLINFLSTMEDGRCSRYPVTRLRHLAATMLESPAFAAQRHNLLVVNARAAELAHDRAAARRFLAESVAIKPFVPNLQLAVMWAVEAEDLAEARRLLAIAETDPRLSRAHRWSYRAEIRGMRQLITLYERQKAPAAP